MQSKKQAAQQAKDLLTVCLAQGIDFALQNSLGPGWFAAFCQEDSLEEPHKQILKNGQQTMMDLDLQALLKILRYRETYADRVLYYYGFLSVEDPFSTQGQKRQLRALLDRLITDFRNQMEAHARAADIVTEKESLYGYEEALRDMEKLSGIFKVILAADGVSYHQKIHALCQSPVGKRSKGLLAGILVTVALLLVAGLAIWLLLPETEPPAGSAITGPTTGNVLYQPGAIKYEEGKVSVSPCHIYYENGDLVAVCYVLNGRKDTVRNVELERFVIHNSNGIICGGAFPAMKDVTIEPYSYETQTFRFPAATVQNQKADLTGELTFTTTITYDHNE